MFFSERKKLADKYEKWISENKNILDCPLNVISWLVSEGYLSKTKAVDLEAKLAESEKKNFELMTKLNLKEYKPAFYTLAGRDCDALSQNKRVLEKLDLIIRSNQELEKENKQLKDKLHTSEQETLHFQNKYFAEKQIAIEELNKVKELLLSKAIQITGTSVDGVRLYSINEIFSNQIKQLKEMK